ncbi:hypothetical protein Tco_0151936 [Tanacetum coccineum]
MKDKDVWEHVEFSYAKIPVSVINGSSEMTGLGWCKYSPLKSPAVSDGEDWGSDEDDVILSSDDEEQSPRRRLLRVAKLMKIQMMKKNMSKMNKDAEITEESKVDEELVNVAQANAEKIDKEKSDSEQAVNDQAVKDAQVKDDDQATTIVPAAQKEKPDVPPSSSSLSVSSYYEITTIQSPTLLVVPVSVIPKQTIQTLTPTLQVLIVTAFTSILQKSTPIPTPPTTSEAPTITTTVHDPLPAVFQRLSDLEGKFKAWTKIGHSKVIAEVVQTNVINEVKNQLPKLLPKHDSLKYVSQIQKIKLEHTVKQLLPKHSAKPFDQGAKAEFDQKEILFKMMRDSKSYKKHPTHQALYDVLMLSLILDENDIERAKTSVQAEEIVYEVVDADQPLNQENSFDNVDDQYDAEAAPKTDKFTWSKQPEWNKGKGPKRQLWYRSQVNKTSTHDVYSTMKILSVVSVIVDKQFGYGYLKEIVVRRANRKLYIFMEGDFPRLHLNDIEDMLLLHVQNKLVNLEGDVIVDLAVALHMYTQRIVFQNRVEDLQLGVESYQKKLNISKPQTNRVDISFKELYTTQSEPQGVIYEDTQMRKRLMCTDELYKFNDALVGKKDYAELGKIGWWKGT